LALRHLALAGLPIPHVLISAEDTPRGKPDPAGYRLAAKRLLVLPADCLAIEDSPAGLRAAFAAGMATIGITNTHDAIELRHARTVIHSLTELRVKRDTAGLLTVSTLR
jgi:sugar-phosphatase